MVTEKGKGNPDGESFLGSCHYHHIWQQRASVLLLSKLGISLRARKTFQNKGRVYLKSYEWDYREKMKKDYQRLKFMLSGLATAKTIKLDSETIEALSLISDFLGSSSPFSNLKVRDFDSLAEGTGNDHVSSSMGNSNLGFWRGHEVNFEFVCLLNLIMNKYPETFEYFTIKNKKFCTIMLNMLCTSVNDFIKISMTEVDSEMIAEYRDVFADLKIFGFNVSWLVSRLNYIEQLQFSWPLLPELHALDCQINEARKKMQEIEKAFGTLGSTLAVGCIGDGLLSSP
ncbi:hypothetical protein POM88_000237 [Heracleum sosnowskyi]|uniref:Uncharacterized protein n=1 Tax=Heracleum sosnowskyi TaxID=360622 RepID=A0AAD8JDX8_9APIA|nr:hypothetical protein POM88_000237 [Heracleum sosnowskyi]